MTGVPLSIYVRTEFSEDDGELWRGHWVTVCSKRAEDPVHVQSRLATLRPQPSP